MHPAERNSELVTDLRAERTRLGEVQMMQVGGLGAADGLILQAYLGKAGLRVLTVERRPIAGGGLNGKPTSTSTQRF